MKLWLDDIRKPPFDFDLHAKTYKECVELLVRHRDKIEVVSLDHDLAPEHYVESFGYTEPPREPDESVNKTSYRVLEWMHDNAWWPEELYIHTLSTFGRNRMKQFCRKYAPRTCIVLINPAIMR